MRCSGSQTTSAAPEFSSARADARDAALAFEAMVASAVMAPVAKELGPLGGELGDAVARATLANAKRDG